MRFLRGLSVFTHTGQRARRRWRQIHIVILSLVFGPTPKSQFAQYARKGLVSEGWRDLVRPDLEADQRVRAKGVGNRHVSCVAALRNQYAADPGDVVARVECAPPPAKVGLEPRGKIHRPIRRRNADVAEVPRAIARRYVHAAAKGDGEVGVVATDALAFVEDIPGALGCMCMLVPKNDMAMNKIANSLHAPPPHGCLTEQIPRYFG